MTLDWLRRRLHRAHKLSAYRTTGVFVIDVDTGRVYDVIDTVFEATGDRGSIVWIKVEEKG